MDVAFSSYCKLFSIGTGRNLTKERHEREKTMQRKKRTKEILTIKNKKKDKVQSIHRRTGKNVVI